jgi:hypothetical protein
MNDNKKRIDTDDVLSIILKILLVFAAIAAAVVAAIKIYETIQAKRISCLCDDFDEYDDDFCICDCDECDEPEITIEEVVEKEINPTEE